MTDKFSTSKAPRGGISPEVKHWRENSQPDDRMTLLFRLPSYADPQLVAAQLIELGVEPQSVGGAVISGNVASKDVDRTLAIREILSVELPEKLSMKSAGDQDDPLTGNGPKRSGYKLPD